MTYPTQLIDKITELAQNLALTPEFGGDLASVPDWKILEILTTDDATLPPRLTPVPARFIRNTLLAQPTLDWARLLIAAEPSNPNQDLRALAMTALGVLSEASDSDIDFADPSVASLFNQVVNALEAAGLINPAVVPLIMAQSARPQSWEQHTGIPVTPDTIAQIRAGN
jgi:hypothetical protein